MGLLTFGQAEGIPPMNRVQWVQSGSSRAKREVRPSLDGSRRTRYPFSLGGLPGRVLFLAFVTIVLCAPANALPARVSGLALRPGNGSIQAWWNPIAGATSYNVYVSTSSSVTPTLFGTSTTNAPAPTTGLTNGTVYYVQVAAVDATGEGQRSVIRWGQPAVSPAVYPPPSGFNVRGGDAHALLNWTAQSDQTGTNTLHYNLYRYVTSAGPSTAINVAQGTAMTITDQGLTNGVSYSYYLRTAIIVGEGAAGTTLTVTPTSGSISADQLAQLVAAVDAFGTANRSAQNVMLHWLAGVVIVLLGLLCVTTARLIRG